MRVPNLSAIFVSNLDFQDNLWKIFDKFFVLTYWKLKQNPQVTPPPAPSQGAKCVRLGVAFLQDLPDGVFGGIGRYAHRFVKIWIKILAHLAYCHHAIFIEHAQKRLVR